MHYWDFPWSNTDCHSLLKRHHEPTWKGITSNPLLRESHNNIRMRREDDHVLTTCTWGLHSHAQAVAYWKYILTFRYIKYHQILRSVCWRKVWKVCMVTLRLIFRRLERGILFWEESSSRKVRSWLQEGIRATYKKWADQGWR